MKSILFLVSSIALSSCATAQLTEGGKGVRFVTESPAGCKYLGEVVGDFRGSKTGGIVSNEGEFSMIDLKNQVAKAGGDTVQVMGGGGRQSWGEAYRCSRAPAAK